ncbi:MAG TPA: YihY/virulence factor BrkB family protein [Longimicrobium sp.]|jgi:membrane protein|uniref:YihY/virulence factor BrkB family protein n=1 Tax=Longimicrobium sp. TaxID=2029185 RepID=UPI002ED9C800
MQTKGTLDLLKVTFKEFMDDECPRLAAALSYYTVFSLPPLMILLLLIAGAVFDPAKVQAAIHEQIGMLMGSAGADEIGAILNQAERPGGRGIKAVLGVGAIIFGATGAFIQLQGALNRAWEVEPDPNQGGLKNFVFKRLLSLGMILGIAFLLLVSLGVSTALSAMGGALGGFFPGIPEPVLYAINLGISFVVITGLFATMFKVLPDARIAWRDVWVGALVTSTLFMVGKFLLGFYLGRSNPGEAFGAAGSLALVLVWIYYSAMILLFGAEFTQTWAVTRGGGIEPEPGARRMADETVDPRDVPARTGKKRS